MKINVKKDTNKVVYNDIDVREPNVGDLLQAENIAGQSEGVSFLTALTSLICTFDGKVLTYEDLQAMPLPFFLQLQTELASSGVLVSEELLSTSSLKGE